MNSAGLLEEKDRNLKKLDTLLKDGDYPKAVMFLQEKPLLNWDLYEIISDKNRPYSSDDPSLLVHLFWEKMGKKEHEEISCLFDLCLDLGFNPSKDNGLMDLFTESPDVNFELFCQLLRKHPDTKKEVILFYIEHCVAFWKNHFEHLFTPDFADVQQDGLSLLLFMWQDYANDYPLDEGASRELCETTKRCVDMGFDLSGETYMGDFVDVVKKSISFAIDASQGVVQENCLELLAYISKKELNESLDDTLQKNKPKPVRHM